MLIVYNFAKKSIKRKTPGCQAQCNHCNQINTVNIVKVTTSFSLYWLPIIPYKFEYFIECANCKTILKKISKSTYKALLQNGSFINLSEIEMAPAL